MADLKAGLMAQETSSDLIGSLRKAFGPTTNTPRTLEERLRALPENTLNLVLSTANMVKLGQSFGSRMSAPESYLTIVERMYPRMSAPLRSLVAEILQMADPLPEITDTKTKQRVDAVQSVIDDYDGFLTRQEETKASLKKRLLQDMAEYEAEIEERYPDSFLQQLAQSESSGQADAEITIKDGRTFTGLYQFGDARLSDYRKATGAKFTTQEFKEDLELQQKVADWHFADIEDAIDALGDEADGYDRDGLKAISHLGGISGMRKYVRTKGKYNPSDALGTSLSDYYDKFSA